jgi:hypothetical protein
VFRKLGTDCPNIKTTAQGKLQPVTLLNRKKSTVFYHDTPTTHIKMTKHVFYPLGTTIYGNPKLDGAPLSLHHFLGSTNSSLRENQQGGVLM